MSKVNWFFTRHGALDQHTKLLTTSTTNTTYTARTGRSADGLGVDRVIRVDGTSGSAMTITLPDGVAYGQMCLVILEVYAATSTVDVTTTTGDDATQMTAAGGYSELQWQGDTLGWVELSNEAT